MSALASLAILGCGEPTANQRDRIPVGSFVLASQECCSYESTGIYSVLSARLDHYGGGLFRVAYELDGRQRDIFEARDSLRIDADGWVDGILPLGERARVEVAGDQITLVSSVERPMTVRFARTSAQVAPIGPADTLILSRSDTMVYATSTGAQLDVSALVRKAIDVNGVESAPRSLEILAPAGWTVSGTTVRGPAGEGEATIRIRSGEAESRIQMQVVRDLSVRTWRLAYTCVGPTIASTADSVRVEASAAAVTYDRAPVIGGGRIPSGQFAFTARRIQFRGTAADTTTGAETIAFESQRPDSILFRAGSTPRTPATVGVWNGSAYVGGSNCPLSTGFRPIVVSGDAG